MEDVQDELQVTEDDFKDMGGRVMQSLEDSVQSIFQGFVEGKDKAKDALLSFLRAISQELTRFMSQAVVRKFLAAFFTPGAVAYDSPGSRVKPPDPSHTAESFAARRAHSLAKQVQRLSFLSPMAARSPWTSVVEAEVAGKPSR